MASPSIAHKDGPYGPGSVEAGDPLQRTDSISNTNATQGQSMGLFPSYPKLVLSLSQYVQLQNGEYNGPAYRSIEMDE